MRRIFYWLSVLLSVATVAVAPDIAHADHVSWMSGFSVSTTAEAVMPPRFCEGVSYEVTFRDGRVYEACVQGRADTMRLARYVDDDGADRHGVAAPFSDRFEYLHYCAGDDICVYVPDDDTLFISSLRYVMVHSDFSTKLERAETVDGYLVQGSTRLLFNGEAGRIRPSLVPSRNGRWLAFGIREAGYGIINTSTLEVGQATWSPRPGYSYSEAAIAVTDDGRTLGLYSGEVGIWFYDTSDCLKPLDDHRKMTPFPLGAMPCPRSEMDGGLLSWNPSVVTNGRFLSGDSQFEFYGQHLLDKRVERFIFTSRLAPAAEKIPYIALGDSYTSGEGEDNDHYYLAGTNVEHEKCHTSYRSYPFLLSDFWLLDVRSVACSGATTADIIGAAGYKGQKGRLAEGGLQLDTRSIFAKQQEALDLFIPGRRPQIDFVSRYRPQVVTVGIGGNDIGLVGKLQSCLVPWSCEWAVSGEMRAKVAKEVESMFSRYVALYTTIKKESSKTAVLAVGYPLPVAVSDPCYSHIAPLLDVTERRFMNETIHLLNQTMYKAAIAAGVRYVDVAASYGDHALCRQTKTPAMNGIRTGDDTVSILGVKIIGAESFHPTSFGHSRVADQIRSEYATAPPDAICEGRCLKGAGWVARSAYWGSQEDIDSTPRLIHLPTLTAPQLTAGLQARVSVDSGVFAPTSMVHIELHSDVRKIATVHVDPDGGVSKDIMIPSDISGQHTLYVIGKTIFDEPIELYAPVFIDAQPSIAKKSPGSLATATPASHDDNNPEVLGAKTDAFSAYVVQQSEREEGGAVYPIVVTVSTLILFLSGIYLWRRRRRRRV